jgi:tetratricopeptide (TPR) repeat protein
MAVPRFLPVRNLYVAVVAVYATVAVLAVWLGPSLRFAAAWLPSYFSGSIPVPEHTAWEDEAARLFKSNEDLDRAKEHLQRALAVEPTASTHFLLGEVLRAQGNNAEALTQYRASIALDPAQAEPYLRTAKLLLDSGDPSAATRVLDDGTIALERARRLQVPVRDVTVRDVFNQKATEAYEELSDGLLLLANAARSIPSRVDEDGER